MSWEQRGTNSYYYKKERHGSKVRSVYVGKGQAAHLIAELQSTSPRLEKLARTMNPAELIEAEKAEIALKQATDLIELMTHAALLTAGFHTHHRQWRRKRS